MVSPASFLHRHSHVPLLYFEGDTISWIFALLTGIEEDLIVHELNGSYEMMIQSIEGRAFEREGDLDVVVSTRFHTIGKSVGVYSSTRYTLHQQQFYLPWSTLLLNPDARCRKARGAWRN